MMPCAQYAFVENLKVHTSGRPPAAHLRVAHVRLHPVPERARTPHIAQVQEANLRRGKVRRWHQKFWSRKLQAYQPAALSAVEEGFNICNRCLARTARIYGESTWSSSAFTSCLVGTSVNSLRRAVPGVSKLRHEHTVGVQRAARGSGWRRSEHARPAYRPVEQAERGRCAARVAAHPGLHVLDGVEDLVHHLAP